MYTYFWKVMKNSYQSRVTVKKNYQNPKYKIVKKKIYA